MYIRKSQQKHAKTGQVYTTYRLVESYRNAEGNVRQQTLLNLGSNFLFPQEQWKALSDRIEEIQRGQGGLFERDHGLEKEAERIAKLLTKQSGLIGLSGGISSDMRHLLGSDRLESRQAIELFVYRCQYHIGALAAALQGIEGLIFTGGIGEHASSIRESIVAGLAWLGADLDLSANSEHQRCISTASSRFPILVIPTDEERTIARAALTMKP